MGGNALWNTQISIVSGGLNAKNLNGQGIFSNSDFSGAAGSNACLFSASQVLTTVGGVNYYSTNTGTINICNTYDTSSNATGYILAKTSCSVTNPFNCTLVNGTTD